MTQTKTNVVDHGDDLELLPKRKQGDDFVWVEARPVVFCLSLGTDKHHWVFQSTHVDLINKLLDKCDLKIARSAHQTLLLFRDHPDPHAILVTDSTLLDTKNECVSSRLSMYVSAGGTVVLGGIFGTEAKPWRLNAFFNRWFKSGWMAPEPASQNQAQAKGQQQTQGQDKHPGEASGQTDGYTQHGQKDEPDVDRYLRRGPRGATLTYNERIFGHGLLRSLPESYCCTSLARYLIDVERQDALYVEVGLDPKANEAPKSFRRQRVPTPECLALTSTPIAFRIHERGRLGFIGDVDPDEMTSRMTLAMMRIL